MESSGDDDDDDDYNDEETNTNVTNNDCKKKLINTDQIIPNIENKEENIEIMNENKTLDDDGFITSNVYSQNNNNEIANYNKEAKESKNNDKEGVFNDLNDQAFHNKTQNNNNNLPINDTIKSKKLLTNYQKAKRKVWHLMEKPQTSKTARVCHCFIYNYDKVDK